MSTTVLESVVAVSTYDLLMQAIANDFITSVRIVQDFTVTAPIAIPSGRSIVINLDGYVLAGSAGIDIITFSGPANLDLIGPGTIAVSGGGSVFTPVDNVKLKICDVSVNVGTGSFFGNVSGVTLEGIYSPGYVEFYGEARLILDDTATTFTGAVNPVAGFSIYDKLIMDLSGKTTPESTTFGGVLASKPPLVGQIQYMLAPNLTFTIGDVPGPGSLKLNTAGVVSDFVVNNCNFGAFDAFSDNSIGSALTIDNSRIDQIRIISGAGDTNYEWIVTNTFGLYLQNEATGTTPSTTFTGCQWTGVSVTLPTAGSTLTSNSTVIQGGTLTSNVLSVSGGAFYNTEINNGSGGAFTIIGSGSAAVVLTNVNIVLDPGVVQAVAFVGAVLCRTSISSGAVGSTVIMAGDSSAISHSTITPPFTYSASSTRLNLDHVNFIGAVAINGNTASIIDCEFVSTLTFGSIAMSNVMYDGVITGALTVGGASNVFQDITCGAGISGDGIALTFVRATVTGSGSFTPSAGTLTIQDSSFTASLTSVGSGGGSPNTVIEGCVLTAFSADSGAANTATISVINTTCSSGVTIGVAIPFSKVYIDGMKTSTGVNSLTVFADLAISVTSGHHDTINLTINTSAVAVISAVCLSDNIYQTGGGSVSVVGANAATDFASSVGNTDVGATGPIGTTNVTIASA